MLDGPVVVFWFRRDLRPDDNHGLWQAASSGRPVLPLFIFDESILETLPRDDARVESIQKALDNLNAGLEGNLHVMHGRPLEIFERPLTQHKIFAVFTNEDYEPYAYARGIQGAQP